MSKGNNYRKGQSSKTNQGNRKPSQGRKPKDKGFRGNSGNSSATNIKDLTQSDILNDVSWYTHNPELAKGVASVNWYRTVGDKLFSSMQAITSDIPVETVYNAQTVPGIASIEVLPFMGIAKDKLDAVNLSAADLYTKIRYNQNKTVPYTQSDLMITILSVNHCYIMYNYLKRAYGVIRTYSPINRYYCNGMLHAMGFDPDIKYHANDIRNFLNIIGARLAFFNLPSTLSIVERQNWLFSNIYLDEPGEQAQMYIFKPRGTYIYDEMSSEKGGMLKFHDFWGRNTQGRPAMNYFDYNSITNLIDSMVQAIYDSEDVMKISSDIKAAYTGSLFTISAVTDDYTVLPVYSAEVLTQIENLTITGTPVGMVEDELTDVSTSWNITQEPDYDIVVCNPYIVRDTYTSGGTDYLSSFHDHSKVINFHQDTNPTPDQVLVATRLMSHFGDYDESLKAYELFTSGTEIVTGVTIFTLGRDDVTHQPIYWGTTVHTDMIIGANGSQYELFVHRLLMAKAFKAFPTTYVFMIDPSGADTKHKLLGTTCSYDSVSEINAVVLDKIHKVCLLSEYNVPQDRHF